MKTPHWLWPAFWGLTGETKEKAIIEYYETGENREIKLARLNHVDEIKYQHAINDIRLKYKKISQTEYDKTKHSIDKLPWVNITSNFEPELGLSGLSFDMEWNEIFIQELRNSEFEGKTEKDLVDSWFYELCKGVVYENGFYDVQEQQDEIVFFQNGKKIGDTRI